MSSLNTFLKVLKKVGYPNPEIRTIAKMVDYDLPNLFNDLIDEIGYEKADNFVWNALQSLSEGSKGIRIDLLNVNEKGAYAYIIISQSRIDLEESDDSAIISWGWGDSHIATVDENGKDKWKTIEQVWEDIDMGDWGDFDNVIDEIKQEFDFKIYTNCGFHVWFDSQI